MEMDSLRGELERLFELDELLKLSSGLLGFNPKEIGGTNGKASFVRALTDYCNSRDALEALCDAVVALKPNADPRLMAYRNLGIWERHDLEPGESLDGFAIQRKLGEGPEGVAYLASRGGEEYRVKTLHPETGRDARGVQRFLTFNRILAARYHPAFPEGLEVVHSEARTYVVQRWFPGESLAARLQRSGPLPQSDVQSILLQVSHGLAALHQRRLCHGNLKLENVLIETDAAGSHTIQLQDAGADLLGSRRAPNGLIQVLSLASPNTVAPERLRGRERHASGDVYALGAIMYELICGTPPFSGETALDAAVGHLTVVPTAPSALAPLGWISPSFDAFILRLLHKDPAERPDSGREVVEEIRELDGGSSSGSEAELQKRIDTLLLEPENEAAAQALEAMAIGSFRAKAYAAFATAAGQIESSGEAARSVKIALLLRAASGLTGTRQLEAAEAVYLQLIALGDTSAAHFNALDDVRKQLGKHEEIVESLLARIETADSVSQRAELMARIGEIYAQDLGDEAQAAVAFSQALCEDPKNRVYVRRIEEIASHNPNLWSEISSTCSEAAADESRPDAERASLLEQMGVWYTDKQGRAELALPCFQTALKLDPKSTKALDGVATVYRANKMWSELGDLLVHRADVSPSPSDARELRTQAAQVLEKHLSDLDGAQELYERIIREDPGDLVVSQALSRIYERNHELDRLVPLLQRQAEEERGARRHTALCRLGDLHRSHLGDLAEARRCYEAVLEEAPTHLLATQGLDQTLAQAGQYKDLLGSLHRQLQHSPTPRQQVALWERIAALYEDEFLLHADAAVALQSVLRLDPTRTPAMASLERLYRTLEQWQDLAELYRQHAELLPEPQLKLPLLLQRARVLAEHVGDLPEAIHVYEQISSLAPERIEALEAVADLHEALGNMSEAIQAVQTVAERVTDRDAKIRYYMRAARLLESQGATEESLEWYARVVALDATHAKATQALRHAYAERGDTAGLIELLRRDMVQAEGERARSRLAAEIATLELTQNRNPAAAEQAARQALDWDPSNLRALVLMGDIAFDAQRYVEAVEHYQSALPRADALPVGEAARLLTRYLDAAEHAPTRSPEHMLRQAEVLLRLTPDDAALVARVGDLAFHHGSPEQAAALYTDLLERFRGSLSADQLALATYRLGESRRRLGDFDAALRSLEEASELAPDSPHPLVAQVQIFEQAQNYPKLVETKRRLLDLLEPNQQPDLLIELGELALDKLSDPKQARGYFTAALDRRPDDRRVLIRLMQIHSQEESWAELVGVVGKLASFVEDPAQKSKYLMTAAMVSARHLARRDQAVAFYRQVLDLDPAHSKALSEYVVLQLEQGDSASAEQALRTRLEMAQAQNDRETQLEMLEALFTLYQGVPGKLSAAVDVAEQAQRLEPHSPVHMSRLKDLYERDAAKYLERAVALHMKTLRQRPNDEDSYRRLRKLYTDARRADSAWCLCQVLHLLKLAQPEETRFFERAHSDQPAPAQSSLDESDWANYLVHPSVDPSLTQIFALIEPVVIAVRGQDLPSLGYDPRMVVDLSTHPYPLGHMLFYAAGIMGMTLPPTFENHHEPGGLLYLNSNPPSIVMGLSALQQLPAQTAAFIAARQLANYRPGLQLRHILSSIPVLKAWLFAAFKACSPHFPVSPELEGPVLEAKAALDRYLTPASRDRLVDIVSRLLQSSPAIDLKEWVTGVDLTADRIGLVVANDLKSVTDIIKTVDDPNAPPRDRRLQELILFAIDEPFFALRRRLGINLESSG
jgi:tetratricopeptide (TPR) repeat protein